MNIVNKNSKIRVIIIDDELRALNRLKILLSHFKEVEVVEQSNDALVDLSLLIDKEPDLVFLDIEMPQKSGLEIAEELKKKKPSIKVIFVTSHEHYAIKAIKHEVFDYILKPVGIDELQASIDRFKKKTYLNLSDREIEIIKLIADGNNSRVIGEKLHISRHTVDTHRRAILEKTDCQNAAELIKYSIKLDLV